MPRGPAAVTDPRAGEVDDGVDAIERGRVEPAVGRIPGDFGAGARLAADQVSDVVTAGHQVRREGASDEA